MKSITIKGIIFEDFINYKKPCMVIEMPYCDFKCGKQYCQNSELAKRKNITTGIKTICNYYINNPITEALVFQGLEPFDSFDDIFSIIAYIRIYTNDDIVIYTGYTKEEITEKGYLNELIKFSNIIIKYGRFLPNQSSHFDNILGIYLASNNQYAEKIS